MKKIYYLSEYEKVKELYLARDERIFSKVEARVIGSGVVPYDIFRKPEDYKTVMGLDMTTYYDNHIWKKANVEKAIRLLDEHGKFIQPDLKRLKIEITYNESVKSGKWFHEKEVTDDTGIKIRKRDNAILGTLFRRISSNNVRIKLLYKKPRGRIFREITPEQAFELGYCIVWH